MLEVAPLFTTQNANKKSAASLNNKRSYDELSKEELVEALKQRDEDITKVQSENKRLKKSLKDVKSSTSAGAAMGADPEKVRAAGLKLRQMAVKGIKSQMKWKPSCKHSKARFSWSSLCDEPTFRAFRGMKVDDKKKGTGKMAIDDFETLVGCTIETSIRYGHLSLVGGNVNINFNKDSGELKVTGGYGL